MEPTESEKLIARIIAMLDSDENETFLSTKNDHEKVVYSWCKNHHIKEPSMDDIQSVEEAYQGEYSTPKEFAEHLADECGILSDMPQQYRNYFDYEAYGRDLFLSGDFWIDEDNGFVFRSL